MTDFSKKWRVNTVTLLHEIAVNPALSAAITPLQILQNILGEVALRASELNDPKLNALMMRLALYEISDPEQPQYDADFVNTYIEKHG